MKGAVRRESFDLCTELEYADEDALARATLSAALAVDAIAAAGEEPVRAAIVDALAPYRAPDGGYRLRNEWRFLLASA